MATRPRTPSPTSLLARLESMSEDQKTLAVLAVIVALVVGMLVAGKTVKIDFDCTFHFGDGCVTGKPYRVVDDDR